MVSSSSRISISPDTLFEQNTLADIYDPNAKVIYDGHTTAANSTALLILASVADGTTTLAESIRLQNSVLAGKVSGAGTGTEVFRDLADTKDRIVATVDSSGNRTALVRDAT